MADSGGVITCHVVDPALAAVSDDAPRPFAFSLAFFVGPFVGALVCSRSRAGYVGSATTGSPASAHRAHADID